MVGSSVFHCLSYTGDAVTLMMIELDIFSCLKSFRSEKRNNFTSICSDDRITRDFSSLIQCHSYFFTSFYMK